MDEYNKGYYIGYLLGCSGAPAIMLYHDGEGFKSNEFYDPTIYMTEDDLDCVDIDKCVLDLSL